MENNLFIDLVLIAVATIGGITDLLKGKIYNWLTFPTIIYGIIANILLFGFFGIKLSISGFIVGAVIFLPFFIVGGFGGGDLKFIAAIGALKGTLFLLNVCVYSALFGGLVSVIILFMQKKLLKTFIRAFKLLLAPFFKFEKEPLAEEKSTSISFGVFISIGVLLSLFFQ